MGLGQSQFIDFWPASCLASWITSRTLRSAAAHCKPISKHAELSDLIDNSQSRLTYTSLRKDDDDLMLGCCCVVCCKDRGRRLVWLHCSSRSLEARKILWATRSSLQCARSSGVNCVLLWMEGQTKNDFSLFLDRTYCTYVQIILYVLTPTVREHVIHGVKILLGVGITTIQERYKLVVYNIDMQSAGHLVGLLASLCFSHHAASCY